MRASMWVAVIGALLAAGAAQADDGMSCRQVLNEAARPPHLNATRYLPDVAEQIDARFRFANQVAEAHGLPPVSMGEGEAAEEDRVDGLVRRCRTHPGSTLTAHVFPEYEQDRSVLGLPQLAADAPPRVITGKNWTIGPTGAPPGWSSIGGGVYARCADGGAAMPYEGGVSCVP